MRLLSMRTGRPAGWRDTCPLEERASAVGVSPKTPGRGKEAATRRDKIREVPDREDAHLRTRPVLPPPPVAPPPDTPCDMLDGAARALAFEMATGSFAIGARSRCRETRLNASYFREGQEDHICRRCKMLPRASYTCRNDDTCEVSMKSSPRAQGNDLNHEASWISFRTSRAVKGEKPAWHPGTETTSEPASAQAFAPSTWRPACRRRHAVSKTRYRESGMRYSAAIGNSAFRCYK